MSKTFALETLKIRMADADLRALDLHLRIQRALGALILDGGLAAAGMEAVLLQSKSSITFSAFTYEQLEAEA
ncbi:MAG: hypothetical protein E2602_20170, partial [Achromobacter sp.]|nr:hypothetical protein [Achromobacter sp.]